MKGLFDKIETVLAGGEVRRYHTAKTMREQRVDSHSWRMAALLTFVWPDCSANLLRAAIMHDVSEIFTGDVPSPVKWRNQALRAELNRISTEAEQDLGIRVPLTEEEATLVRWADYTEGSLFCLEELESGNLRICKTLVAYMNSVTSELDSPNGPRRSRQALVRYGIIQRLRAVPAYGTTFINPQLIKE